MSVNEISITALLARCTKQEQESYFLLDRTLFGFFVGAWSNWFVLCVSGVLVSSQRLTHSWRFCKSSYIGLLSFHLRDNKQHQKVLRHLYEQWWGVDSIFQRGKSCFSCVLVKFESLHALVYAINYYHFHTRAVRGRVGRGTEAHELQASLLHPPTS